MLKPKDWLSLDTQIECLKLHSKKDIQMETIHRKTSRKAQVSMGRRCEEWYEEEEEAYEVGRTSAGPP
jgi:hypothetical protein